MEELIFNIITYLIVAVAMFVAGKKTVEKVFIKKQNSGCGDGCGGCSTACDLKDLAANVKKDSL